MKSPSPTKGALYSRRYRERHPERVRNAQKNENARRHKVGRAFIDNLKLSRGCADCGYAEHPAALDFDHRPGEDKLYCVGALWGSSRATILAEAAKCDVVCANCHRIRTWKRRRATVVGDEIT